MPKTRKGSKSAPAPKGRPGRKPALLAGLPDWIQSHARESRRGAKTPSEVVQRWGGVLDGILGRYLKAVDEDALLLSPTDGEDGANWEGLVRVVTPLAEARRKMAATEAELQPRSYDRVEVTIVGGLPGETIWSTEHVNEDGSAVIRVTGSGEGE